MLAIFKAILEFLFPPKKKIEISNADIFCLVAEHFGTMDIKEVGYNRGEWIDRFTNSVKGELGESWCLNFVQAQTKVSIVRDIVNELVKLGNFSQIQADNYLAWIQGIDSRLPDHRHCMTLFRWAKTRGLTSDEPRKGSIAVWNYVGTDKGHAGVCRGLIDNARMSTTEGNTGSPDHVEREGDGVYNKVRFYVPKETGNMKLMGFINLEALERIQ